MLNSPITNDNDAALFIHSCNAWPGLSGSPILTHIDGQSYVVGIHLGQRWIVGFKGRLSIGKFVDETIESALRAVDTN